MCPRQTLGWWIPNQFNSSWPAFSTASQVTPNLHSSRCSPAGLGKCWAARSFHLSSYCIALFSPFSSIPFGQRCFCSFWSASRIPALNSFKASSIWSQRPLSLSLSNSAYAKGSWFSKRLFLRLGQSLGYHWSQMSWRTMKVSLNRYQPNSFSPCFSFHSCQGFSLVSEIFGRFWCSWGSARKHGIFCCPRHLFVETFHWAFLIRPPRWNRRCSTELSPRGPWHWWTLSATRCSEH